jgi:hypothetical protein
MSKRTIVALLTGLAVFSGVYGMAAGLGGVTSSKVSADNIGVTSCDSDGVSTAYTSGWDATDKRYEVSTVTVSGVNDACDGLSVFVTLTDASGAQIGTGTLAMPSSGATSFGVSLVTAASAKLVENVHVSIAS